MICYPRKEKNLKFPAKYQHAYTFTSKKVTTKFKSKCRVMFLFKKADRIWPQYQKGKLLWGEEKNKGTPTLNFLKQDLKNFNRSVYILKIINTKEFFNFFKVNKYKYIFFLRTYLFSSLSCEKEKSLKIVWGGERCFFLTISGTHHSILWIPNLTFTGIGKNCVSYLAALAPRPHNSIPKPSFTLEQKPFPDIRRGQVVYLNYSFIYISE